MREKRNDNSHTDLPGVPVGEKCPTCARMRYAANAGEAIQPVTTISVKSPAITAAEALGQLLKEQFDHIPVSSG
jgi:hypothetical protein